MFISFIFQVNDQCKHLDACLEVLCNQIATELLYTEVIVSDDTSSDNVFLLVHEKFPKVVWVPGPNAGSAANRNNGAKYANGDWFAFIEDGYIPERDYLLQLSKAIISNPLSQLIVGSLNSSSYQPGFAVGLPFSLQYVRACNITVRRNLFILFEGFCEAFPIPYFENADFLYTLSHDHFNILYSHEITFRYIGQRHYSILFRLGLIYPIRLLSLRHPYITNSLNQQSYPHKFIHVLKESTSLLIKLRFRALKEYIENSLIRMYYLVML